MPRIMIVDRVADAAVVWRVEMNPTLNPLVGAWVLPLDDSRLRSILADPWYVATDDGRSVFASTVMDQGAQEVSLADVVGAVEAERDRLQGLYEAAQAGTKSNLISPAWPKLPSALDVNTPTPLVACEDPRVQRALTLARWLGRLVSAWESIEDERLRREWGRKDAGTLKRNLPLRVHDSIGTAGWAPGAVDLHAELGDTDAGHSPGSQDDRASAASRAGPILSSAATHSRAS